MSDSLTICDDYGHSTYVLLINATSRRALSRKVRELSPGSIPIYSDYDCTGKVCGRYASLIRAYRDGTGWIGLVQCSISRDV